MHDLWFGVFLQFFLIFFLSLQTGPHRGFGGGQVFGFCWHFTFLIQLDLFLAFLHFFFTAFLSSQTGPHRGFGGWVVAGGEQELHEDDWHLLLF